MAHPEVETRLVVHHVHRIGEECTALDPTTLERGLDSVKDLVGTVGKRLATCLHLSPLVRLARCEEHKRREHDRASCRAQNDRHQLTRARIRSCKCTTPTIAS